MKPKLYPVNVPLVVDYKALLKGIQELESKALDLKANKIEVALIVTLCTYLKHIRNEVEHRYWAQIKEQRKKEASG